VLARPEIARMFPGGAPPTLRDCQCKPWITVGCARQPFGDRVVVIGDACISRLYKDGIGSAFTTANAAASAAILFGVSRDALRQSFWPVIRSIDVDNRFGRILFWAAHSAAGIGLGERTLAGALRRDLQGESPSISQVVWDMLTGSRPYKDIFRRAVGLKSMAMVVRGLGGVVSGRGGSDGSG